MTDANGRSRLTPSDIQGQGVINVTELASLLGVSVTAARQALKDGQVPSVRIGRRWMVPVPRLLAYLGYGPEQIAPTVFMGDQ